MSYHVQNNSQQKTTGFFIVVAFHAVLLVGLISGLQSDISTKPTPDPFTTQIVEKKNIPIPIPAPVTPTISTTTVTTIMPPTTVTFDPFETLPPVTTSENKTDITQSIIVTKPKILKATKPEYPIASARLNEEGATGLSLYITAEGRVADVKLDKSSGSARLDDAAIKHAQRNWAFSPCTEGDKPVACWFKTKLVWRLEDAKR